jgi:phosphatidylserine/phosphatidylglycerophosphate/cardiolipin synthase-like enzyme
LPYSQDRNSEKNAENLLVIRAKELPERYMKELEKHKRHSEAHIGRGR